MGSKYIVVVKYKDDDRLLLHSAKGNYKEAEEVRDYIRSLGHLSDVISITGLI